MGLMGTYEVEAVRLIRRLNRTGGNAEMQSKAPGEVFRLLEFRFCRSLFDKLAVRQTEMRLLEADLGHPYVWGHSEPSGKKTEQLPWIDPARAGEPRNAELGAFGANFQIFICECIQSAFHSGNCPVNSDTIRRCYC